MSNEVESLVKQAKEQARRENLKNFFYKNSKTFSRLSIAAVGLVIFLAIFSYFQNSRQAKYSQIFHQSLIYQQLGDEAKTKESLQQIYNAKMAPSGVKSLASLRLAAIYFEEKNQAEAEKIYLELTKCRFCDKYIRDLSGFLLIKSWISNHEISEEQLLTDIQKIENSNKIFKYHIAEQRAFIELSAGNFEKSHQIFELIQKSSESSVALKERADNGIKILFSKGFSPKTEETLQKVN
jgi:hypothetical protein